MRNWFFPLTIILVIAGAASAEADQKKPAKPKQIVCNAQGFCRDVAPGCHLEYTARVQGGKLFNVEVCDGRK